MSKTIALTSMRRILVLSVFFLSGAAALLYQVVWQRSLFAIVGINSESVTIVVTAFMLGLGVGSLVGGRISTDPRRPVLLYFSVAEACIGCFGLVSLQVFRLVGQSTLHMGYAGTFITTLVVLIVPTALMGGTLPLLVAHLVRSSGNVGRSVGVLYCVNTVGSAVASFVSVLYLLAHFGQQGTTRIAALMNGVAALVMFVEYMQTRVVRS